MIPVVLVESGSVVDVFTEDDSAYVVIDMDNLKQDPSEVDYLKTLLVDPDVPESAKEYIRMILKDY